ncbi:MAG: flippase [Cyanobacteria bacterium P01_F01_bin.150]
MLDLIKITQKLKAHHEFTRIFSNVGWLLGDRVLRMGIGLFVSVWVARYLGVEQFGALSFAIAFVGLFNVFSTLGLKDIVIRSLVAKTFPKEQLLGTVFVLKLLGGLLVMLIASLTILALNNTDETKVALVIILSASGIFLAFDTIELWFQSQVQAKYSVIAKNISFVITNVAKVNLISVQASLVTFAWAALATPVLSAFSLTISYLVKRESLIKWRWNLGIAKSLLKESWPLILSSVAIVIYMKVDTFMLGSILGNQSVGLYTSATRISEAWYFVAGAVASSVEPGVYTARKQGDIESYYRRIGQLLRVLCLIAVAIALPVSFFSNLIITTLYGNAFASAGLILSIYIWAALFVFIGLGSNCWFIAEGLTQLTFYRTLAGAVMNVSLNLLLIPRYGGVGAAIATVISQAIASFLSNAIDLRTKNIFFIQLKSIFQIRI